MTRNPHAGEPFTSDDAAIAAALEDVNIPALLASLVHMTGDPTWIRDDITLRFPPSAMDLQAGVPEDEQAGLRRRAVPVIAAYRDAGCEPHDLSPELVAEVMAFVGCRPVEGRLAGLFRDDLQLEGGDANAVTWGDEIPADVKAASPVVVIGCGMAGILAGIRLKQAGIPFTILEKNDGPGGTWWENRYPGARVDIGSHQYCYSFEPADHWTEYYCRQPELRAYFTAVVDKYGLREHCRFDTAVTSVHRDDQQSQWTVTTAHGDVTETLEARFVISGVGSLNTPKLPDIPGMDSFAGPAFHSARWPEDLDIRGKKFALVGAGASGFQIAPTVVDEVEHLSIFQRTAQWMFNNPLYHAPVPAGDRWAQRHLPYYSRWYRFVMSFAGIAMGMEPYRIDPAHTDETSRSINEAHAVRAANLLSVITSALSDRPDLLEKVVPDYPAAGKRMLQDNGTWLRTLARPDVDYVRTGIDHIEADAIVTTDGTRYPADVICYATGFAHNDFLSALDIRGREGRSLREQWGDEPLAYLGITIAGFPNLFCVYGPGTNLAAGASLFYHTEFQVHYAMEAIRATLTSGTRAVEVTQEAYEHYGRLYRDEIDAMVWSHSSIRHSHYKNPNGKIYTLSPWSLDRYWEWTREVDKDHYAFS